MNYSVPLIEGTLVRRYKRFLTDIVVKGEKMTVVCPNTGSMDGLTGEGNPVRISGPYGGTRKYAYTLEQICITRPDDRKIWIGVNTAIPNKLAEESALAKRLPGFEDYTQVRREVKISDKSRIDLLLEAENLPKCWIEVKNVTLVLQDPKLKSQNLNMGNIAAFPDAKTTRGAKHLRELAQKIGEGDRAAMVYVIQRADGEIFSPAAGYDPDYAEELKRAIDAGVEIIPLLAEVTEGGVVLTNEKLPILKI